MPKITSADGTRLYYEEAGTGTPVVFVHEFAGDYRHLGAADARISRARIAASPSPRAAIRRRTCRPIRRATARTSCARDVVAIMDALGIDKAHVVGHSMGAYTALHVGMHHPERCISVTAAGCGWGSVADPAAREAMRKEARGDRQDVHATKASPRRPRSTPTARRARRTSTRTRAAMRNSRACSSEHSAHGHALTMSMLQAKRPTLWDMEAELKRFSVPLLIVVGDEDDDLPRRQRLSQAHRADRRPPRHSALGPHHHQRGAGRVQRRARGVLRRRRSRALAGAQAAA